MSYIKRIFSLIIIFFLSTLAIADGLATYLPLTTSTNDGSWILLGVNGFSDGRASSRSDVAAGFSTDYVEVNDTDPQDNLSTWGISASGAVQPALDNLLAVQGIDDTSITTLKVAAEVLVPFVSTEAIRSMYIRVNSTTPNVKIDYKSSMEGQKLEIFIGSQSPLYSVNLSQNYTYKNPAIAVLSTRVSSSIVKLSSITDVIDYQFADNPLDAKYYSKINYLDNTDSLSTPAKSATFYHFDAVSQQWKVWNTHFVGRANDFTAFSKGDAYWGRIDVDDSPIENDGTQNSGVVDSDGNAIHGSGLVLGRSGKAIPDSSVYKDENNISKLSDGWNMLSFDDVRPYIRHAATGLVVTSLESAGDIILSDSTSVNSIQITLSADSVDVQAMEINKAIEISKLRGTLPKSFNIKAFASDTTLNPKRIILISDAKFSIEDEAGADNIAVVETLTGNNPFSSFGVQTDIFTNLESNSTRQKIAISAYGEYSLIVDIMTNDLRGGSTTASALDSISASAGHDMSAKVAFGTLEKDYPSVALNLLNDTQADAASAKIAIESHPLFDKATSPILSYGKAIVLDSMNDGTEDKMIISSTTPFYIKDSTYTRVFDYTEATGDDSRKFEVVGSHSLTVKPTTAQAVADVATYINDNADENAHRTGVYAGVDGGKIIAVSTTLSSFDIKDLEDGNYEFFKSTTSDADLAKGAVKGVYALDTIAKMPLILHSFSFDTVIIPDDASDSIAISINGGSDTPTLATQDFIDDTNDTAQRVSYFDRIVASINADILTDNIHAFAFHNYDPVSDDFAGTKITIEGFEANNITFTMVNGGGNAEAEPSNLSDANAATLFTLGSSWTSIIPDLKSNAIYAPNFVSYGPLYTIRQAGYDVNALLKATTNMQDLSISWSSIDITRDEDDWFKNNEFNLFSIDHSSGYWAYLSPKTNDSIDISSPSYQASYTYYFDNNDSNGEYVTSNIINGGQFSVTIQSDNNDMSSAYVSISGEEVPLKGNTISNKYTANFTKYALKAFNESATGPISMTIRATNGKGEASLVLDAYKFDYMAPNIDAPTTQDANVTLFHADDNVTKFFVYKEYIPELYSSRVAADPNKHRLVGSYDANSTGYAKVRLCKELTFGHVDNLRVVAVDGLGQIGFSNISNAKQFKYATILNNSHVIKDIGGDSNKTSIGERYTTECLLSATQPADSSDNNGISLKQVDDANLTGRLIYEVIDGVNLSTSVPWTTAYSIGGDVILHTENQQEYKSKPFFYQYDNKVYIGAFPANSAIASSSLDDNASAIPLDDTTAFTLDGEGNSNGGTGNNIVILNNTLLMP